MNLFYQKIREKENGRDTFRATPVVVRRSCSDLRECDDKEECDHDHVVHRVICGADYHCLIFGSRVAHSCHVAIERTLVLKPVEQTRDNERDSSRERNTNQAVYETELDRLLGDGAPFVMPLAEAPFLRSRQEREYERKGEEEHGNHQPNRDARGVRTFCDRLDEHVATPAEEVVDPTVVETGNLPQCDCCRNRQGDDTKTLEEHLESKPPPHRPDELVVSPFGNERKRNTGDGEQDENSFANREQDFHPATSCIWFENVRSSHHGPIITLSQE